MAKDDSKPDGGEEYEFEVPDFDEDTFIHKELVSFRTTSILFAWGIIAALISWGLWEATGSTKTGWYLGLVVVVVFGYLLRYVYKALKVDIAHFGRREWFGTFFLLFFAWMAFFILFVNPPISDHADPTVNVFTSPSVQQLGGDVTLDLFFSDNGRIDAWDIEVTRGTTMVASEADFERMARGHWAHTFEDLSAGEYAYTLSATDSKGNSVEVTDSFHVKSRAIRVDIPDDGRLDSPGEEVIVTIDGLGPCEGTEIRDGGDCLRTVYLVLDNGNDLHLDYDESLGWIARTSYAGWTIGENQFNVVAEQANRFQGATMIEGGDLILGGFNVTIDAVVGEKEANVVGEVLDAPITRRTPGIGPVAIMAGLIGLVAIARRKQE